MGHRCVWVPAYYSFRTGEVDMNEVHPYTSSEMFWGRLCTGELQYEQRSMHLNGGDRDPGWCYFSRPPPG